MAELLQDFLTREIEDVPNLIGRGVLPVRSKCIVAGEPKTNKSFVITNLGIDLARGTPAFGARYKSGTPVLPVVHPCRVLLFDQEVGEQGLRKRMAGMFPEPDKVDFPLYIKSRDMALRIDTPEGRLAISREIDEVRPDVVIMDPLAKFHLQDENSAQAMSAVLRAVDHWIEEFGCSVIILHHVGKESQENPRRGGARIRGSSAIFGDIDTYIEVVRESSATAVEPVLQLSFELRQGEPLHPIFIRRQKNGWCTYLGEDYRKQTHEPPLPTRGLRGFEAGGR